MFHDFPHFFVFDQDQAAVSSVLGLIAQFLLQSLVHFGAPHGHPQRETGVLGLEHDEAVAGTGGAFSDSAPLDQCDFYPGAGKIIRGGTSDNSAADHDSICFHLPQCLFFKYIYYLRYHESHRNQGEIVQ